MNSGAGASGAPPAHPARTCLLAFWRLAGRNRRRYGGYIIHLGVVLMALGIIGIEMFQTETQGTIPQGESLTLGDYTVTLRVAGDFRYPGWAQCGPGGGERVSKNGKSVGELHPRRDYYYESQQPMTIPGRAQHAGR